MSKYLISVDMEGICGISDGSYVIPKQENYDMGIKYLHQEVNSVIEGIFAKDEKAEIIVRDAHGHSKNLNLEMLNSKVFLYSGWNPVMNMVDPIDETFDGLFLYITTT